LPRVGQTSSVTVQLEAGKTLRAEEILVPLTAARLNNEKAPADLKGQKPGSGPTKALSEATIEEVKRGNLAVAAVKACHLHAAEEDVVVATEAVDVVEICCRKRRPL
jgi:hypothetical protein